MAKGFLPDRFASSPGGGSWRKTLGIACIALCLVGVGVLAGFFAGRDSKTLQKAGSSNPPNILDLARGVSYNEMPEYGTPAAQAFMNAAGTPGSLQEIYNLAQDSAIISEDLMRAFIDALREQFISDSQFAFLGNSTLQVDLPMFRRVAKDLLNYLRYTRSVAILGLLRRFSGNGGGVLAITDVDPDVLRGEIQVLLNLTTFNSYYAAISNKGCDRTKRNITLPNIESILASLKGGDGGDNAVVPTAGRRLLLEHNHQHIHDHQHGNLVEPAHQHLLQHGSSQHHRHLHQVLNTTAINITRDESAAAAEAAATNNLMPTSVQEMLCEAQGYSPIGLQGVGNFSCPVNSSMPKAPFGDLLIPMAFHAFRYVDENGLLQPPMWRATEGAQNIVDVVNEYYNNTGIQFRLQEVRTDPKQFPYLLMKSLADWQACSRNDAATDQGMACLEDKATNPNVSSLTSDYVINMLVLGSQSYDLCQRQDPICNSLALGFANPYGPWFGPGYDPTWREGLVSQEWVYMQYDEFIPMRRNNLRSWNAGACTLAHELGHYLGLRHTHQGDCSGNGDELADAVPDTPANMEFWAFTDANPTQHLQVQLASWCTEFREGKKPRPQAKDLLKYNSCPTVNPKEGSQLVVDNVFNLLSYLPDACCMVMTKGQVARMHEMIVQYRPGMIARRSVGAV